ncbi:LPS export ABC transporter periplasmic protein LptC [bacterium]|nr:MAG: LPS export ABC transporter periplasmic protein LptC [bacterium]
MSILSICLFFVQFCGCASEDETEQSSSNRPQSQTTAEQVKVKFTESGRLQAILYSNRMEEKDNLTWSWNIDVDFFTDDDTIADGGMKADSGYVLSGGSSRKRQVTVFGNVHLIAPDGTELFADSLRWNPAKQQIESNSKVKVIRGKDVVEGIGFESDPNFMHIRIINVKGKLEQL